MQELVTCSSCRTEIQGGANFCPECGTKLKEICDCWVLHKLYNCGEEKCPGYKVYKSSQQQAD